MSEPIKFDFPGYTAAIPAIHTLQEHDFSGQEHCYSCDSAIPNDDLPTTNSKIAGVAEHSDSFEDVRCFLKLEHRLAIVRWMHSIDETEKAAIDDVLQYCASNPDALAYYLERSKEALHEPEEADDRRHCRECLNLRNGYCIKQRFRPVDDIPRRCKDFRAEPLLNDQI